MRSKIFTRTVGYWPLQESSGQALDYSGNENHASTTNVSNYGTSGPLGASVMEFDGEDDYIELNHWHGTPITLSVWVKPESTSDSNILRARPNGSKNYSIEISNGNFRFQQANGNIDTSVAVNAGEWYHLVNVVEEQGETHRVYVNGRNEGSIPVDTGYSTTSNCYIGSDQQKGRNFDGRIAHVRVWDYPFPEASIRALYNASRGGFSESDSRTL